MGQFFDKLWTALGLNFDNSESDLDSYGSPLDINELNRNKSFGLTRNYSDCIECEQQIIKCRKKHGRVLGIESKALRQRFGDTCVDLALYRTSQRKYRGHCDVKEQDENYTKEIIKIAEAVEPILNPKDDFSRQCL